MTKHWSTREYKEGDEQAIRRLYHLVFGKEMSARYWAWEYEDNPAGQPVITLAESEDGIVGQYALIPLRMKVRDKICLGSLSLDTMVHPECRGQGMFIELARHAYNQAAARGIEAIYGFPNENSHHGFLDRLGWVDLCKGIPLWVKPLDMASIVKKRVVSNRVMSKLGGKAGEVAVNFFAKSKAPAVACSVRQVPCFDKRVDVLWEEVPPKSSILVVRDFRYLTWRYVEKPGETYAILIAEEGHSLLGYTVVKCSERFGLQIGFVMDILGTPKAIDTLIAAGVRYFRDNGMDVAGCLMLPTSPYSDNLRQMGFVPAPRTLLPHEMHLGVGPISPPTPTESVTDPRSWLVTWGDNDDV